MAIVIFAKTEFRDTVIPQVDNAVQGIYVVTHSLIFAAYFGGTVTNLLDKVFSATVSLFVYRVIRKFRLNIIPS